MDTGAAYVAGVPYENTSLITVNLTQPSSGNTGWRLVLRASWSAQTVRVTLLQNTDGNSTIPAATQSLGTTWDLTLATGVITTAGAVAPTLLPNWASSHMIWRQNAASAPLDFTGYGTTNYGPINPRIQVGAAFVAGSGGITTINFPKLFKGLPMIFLNPSGAVSAGSPAPYLWSYGLGSFQIKNDNPSALTVYWLALGM